MTILTGLPMLTFLLVYFILNYYIKRMIPDKKLRKKFKSRNEFIIALAYFFMPFFLLQNEVIFLRFSSVKYAELQIFLPLAIFKIAVFILACINLESVFHNLKKI